MTVETRDTTPRTGFVLAAGLGRRMGGPKGLLLVEGQPLLRLHVNRLFACGISDVHVAVPREHARSFEGVCEATRFARGHSIFLVASDAPDAAGSLALLVARIGLELSGIALVTPVDVVPAEPSTIFALGRAIGEGVRAATPSHGKRGGHPVVCRADVLAPYRACGPGNAISPPPLRDVLSRLGHGRVRVPVNDPNVALDLDLPSDVEALTGSSPRFAHG